MTLAEIITEIRQQIHDTDSGRISSDDPIKNVVNRVYNNIVVREKCLLASEAKTKADIVTAGGIFALTRVFLPLQVYVDNIPLNYRKAATIDYTGLAAEGTLSTSDPANWYQIAPSEIRFYPVLATGADIVLVYGHAIPVPLALGTDQPIALPLGTETVLIDEASSILRTSYWLSEGTATLAANEAKRGEQTAAVIAGIVNVNR